MIGKDIYLYHVNQKCLEIFTGNLDAFQAKYWVGDSDEVISPVITDANTLFSSTGKITEMIN